MTLSYRGARYAYQPPTVEQLESDLKGQYRGHQLQFSYPHHIPPSHPVVTLTYRGVRYQTTATGATQPVTSAATGPLQDMLALRGRKAQTQRSAVMQELASVHHHNLYELLEHRIQVARSKGDEQLVAQLEQERHQLA